MAKYTIKLKKFLDIQEEYLAGGTITPGMLLEFMTSTALYALTVKAHATAGGNALPVMFALEDELQGNDIKTNYSSGDRVQVWIPQRGEEVYAILADGEDVNVGDPLESNGAGYLQKHVADVESFESAEAGAITVYPQNIVAVALEHLDLGSSSGEEESSGVIGYNKRIKVKIV